MFDKIVKLAESVSNILSFFKKEPDNRIAEDEEVAEAILNGDSLTIAEEFARRNKYKAMNMDKENNENEKLADSDNNDIYSNYI